jgi:DNA-binding transcriptional regulator of glucitol operon
MKSVAIGVGVSIVVIAMAVLGGRSQIRHFRRQMREFEERHPIGRPPRAPGLLPTK